MSVLRGDPIWKIEDRSWNYLWETPGTVSHVCNHDLMSWKNASAV